MLCETHYPIVELEFLVEDMEELNEYLNGWDDAIVNDYWYKKEYVDTFMTR